MTAAVTEEPAQTRATDIAARLIPIDDVALLLGVCRATVERMLASGRIPAPRRIGRANRWDRTELDAWLSRPLPNGQLQTAKAWATVWASLVKAGRN